MIMGVVVKGNWGFLSLQFQLFLIHVPMMGNEFFPENVFIYSNAPNVSHEIILKEPKYKQSEHQHQIRV